jgi:hypothetical protein
LVTTIARHLTKNITTRAKVATIATRADAELFGFPSSCQFGRLRCFFRRFALSQGLFKSAPASLCHLHHLLGGDFSFGTGTSWTFVT